MVKVAGVDFSELSKFREHSTVKMPDGTIVELPLIKVRDASTATLMLQRHDTLVAKYGIIVCKIKNKTEALNDIKEKLAESSDDTLNDEHMDVLNNTATIVTELQKRLIENNKEMRQLCDEIHEFLKEYLNGTGVIEQLKEYDNRYTIAVLQLMLYGEDSHNESEEDKEAQGQPNPTTTQSQSI